MEKVHDLREKQNKERLNRILIQGRKEQLENSYQHLLEIDFGTYNLQTQFYGRFIRFCNSSVSNKEEQFQVSLTLQNQTLIFLTQQKLQNCISEFRLIYKQFSLIKSQLQQFLVDLFDRNFDFQLFCLFKETIYFQLKIEKKLEKSQVFFFDQEKQTTQQKEHWTDIKSFLFNALRIPFYVQVKSQLEQPGFTAEQICFNFVNNHLQFFRYVSNLYDLQMEYNENNKENPLKDSSIEKYQEN